MNVQEFLEDLDKRDIQVWAEGDRLRCSAAFGMLTPELRERLKEYKLEILEFLSAAAIAQQQRAVVPLQPRGARTPVFAVAGHNGDVFCYRTLAQHLGDDQPFFALQPPGLDGQSEPSSCVEDLAEYFADQIWTSHSSGPYIIAGYCAGGSIAFELARELQERGGAVSFLALFGCPYPTFYRFMTPRSWARRLFRHTRDFAALSSLEARRDYFEAKAQNLIKVIRENKASQEPDPLASMRSRVERATVTAASRYTPNRFAGRLTLFLPNKEWAHTACTPSRWRPCAAQVDEYFGPDTCDLNEMLHGPNAMVMAELFRRAYEKSSLTPSRPNKRELTYGPGMLSLT